MKTLFLDTEFNGFGGELISMALVADDGAEWYGVRVIPEAPDPWVAKHVLPLLGAYHVVTPEAFTESLREFLVDFDGARIIADWPADFQHLAAEMAEMGRLAGFNMPITCTMHLVHSKCLLPDVPHNALSDARALRDWYLTPPTREELQAILDGAA